jgi:hypothetical protein
LAINFWIYLERNCYQSCIYSIASAANHSDQLLLLADNNKDWIILTETQTDNLLSKIQPNDCGEAQNPNYDLRGRK